MTLKKSKLIEHNPKSIKKKQFIVRLNEYYINALKILKNPEEGISMQKICSGFIERGIDKLLKERKIKL